MNKLFATLSFILIYSAANAQYFYKDIVSNKQLSADMATYKKKKVHTIKIKSFEEDDSPSKGFFCEKKISKDFKTSELFTRSDISSSSLFTAIFNDNGQIINSIDSSAISITRNYYTYDAAGRILKTASAVKSSDDDFNTEILEEHIYDYNAAGIIVSMSRVKDKHDSTKILFLTDEKNNISIEKDTKNGRKYYYYYDDNNRLTDIAHANEYREKLVADYVFEYDEAGQLVQMTITEEGRGKEAKDAEPSFFIWRYLNENGLRTTEGLFSKNGKLMGTIKYEYN